MKASKLLVHLFIAGFATNLVWENLQAPLYEGYDGFGQHFLFCLLASIIDGVMIVAFYVIVGLIRKNGLWLSNFKLTDIVILLVLGILTGITFETFALKNEAWEYNEKMPLIFGVGLMPLLQLAILSVVSVFLVKVVIQPQATSD